MVVILAPFGVAGLLLAAACLHLLQRYLRHHGLLTVLARLAVGHHSHGRHLNNRTWFQAATRAKTGNWHMGWLARRSRVHRMVMFWGGLLAVTYLVIGWLADRALTVTLLWVAGISTLVIVMLRVARRLARRKHRKTVVHPIAAKLAVHMKQSPVAVARNLKIRPALDKLAPGDVAAMLGGFPDEYRASAADQEFVEGVFTSFLPVSLKFDWETARFPMRMVARCKAAPPKEVLLGHYADAIDALGAGEYFLGCSAGNIPEIWDANAEDPHGCCNALTRGGKTNLNLAIAAPALRRGEDVDAVDPKRVSLRILVGVPGFRLAADPRDVAAMWALIRSFRERMDAVIDGICLHCRTQRTGAWNSPCPGCARVPVHALLILEEINQLFELFRAHWERIKEPGQRITDVPAWADVRAVLHQGGQFGFKVWVDGQDLKDRVVFNSRSQFGKVMMGKFADPQWRYVARTTPIPPPPTKRGRFAVIEGGTHRWVQVVCADPRKGHGADNERGWREFALNGRDAGAEPLRTRRWPTVHLPLALPRGRDSVPEQRAIPRVLIGNAEAAAYLGMRRNTFITARRRTPVPGEFSTDIRGGDQPAWTRESLDTWAGSRQMADAQGGR
jgi:hypothetical protein